jgi:hypothetical protein
MKICPVVAELLHADGRTDTHDEANKRFTQFKERALKFEERITCQTRHIKGIISKRM